MPKKKNHVRVDHYRKILDKYPVSVNQIDPGDLFEFKYKGDNIFDKNPLIIFIYYEFILIIGILGCIAIPHIPDELPPCFS